MPTQTTPPETVTSILGRFAATVRWEDVPEVTRHEAKRTLLNFFGAALGAAHQQPIDAIVAVLGEAGSAGEGTLIGRSERLGMLDAAFVNAVCGNYLDFDDTHLRTVIHPAAPIVPALLAAGERRGASGAAVLHALLLGGEVACRLGSAVSPWHYTGGWHITASCGVFGAAAGSSRLLKLDATGTAHALGIAASQSSSITENLACGAKNVGMGNAARNGLLSALMAERGYTGAPQAIEGPQGWARATGGTIAMREITGGLGEHWEIGTNTYKPYPCGIVMHSLIDACLDLRARHSLAPAAIRRVTVRGQQLLLTRTDRVANNERDAKISLQHGAAVALLFGAAGVEEFSEPVVQRPDVAALRARVFAEADQSMPVGAAFVSIETDAGTFDATVVHPRGSLQHPMTDAELEAKVTDLARAVPTVDAQALIDAVWGLDRASDIRALMKIAGGVS